LTLLFTQESRKGVRTYPPSSYRLIKLRNNAVVVDRRSKKDYAAGHIVDSVNIPSEALTKRMSELTSTKNKARLLGLRQRPAFPGPCAKSV